jgi:hypothetical protein
MPLGANTVPLMLVVPPPEQVCCWRQRLMHVLLPQTFAVAAPQVWPAGQVPQSSASPQPSVAGPQSRPCCAQLLKAGQVPPSVPPSGSGPPSPPSSAGPLSAPPAAPLPPPPAAVAVPPPPALVVPAPPPPWLLL